MAYRITYWADDNGKGQYALRVTRIKSTNEAFSLSLPHQHPNGTVLVTMDRTDHQSPIEKILWQKPGYVDPCTKVGE